MAKSRSLFTREAPVAENEEPAKELPYVTGMSTGTPVLALGVEMDSGEVIIPWASLQFIQRKGEQAMIIIGDWEFTLQFDSELAKESDWKIFDLIDSLHDQTTRWIRHRPKSGLTVTGELKEEDD